MLIDDGAKPVPRAVRPKPEGGAAPPCFTPNRGRATSRDLMYGSGPRVSCRLTGGVNLTHSTVTARFAFVPSRHDRREAGMKYVDYMAMSPEDRMVFYSNLDNKTDRQKILFFRAQAELMLGRAWRRQKHRIVAALREYDARYGITEDDLK
jgi:hypothetical protein